jgi:SIR2-like domain
MLSDDVFESLRNGIFSGRYHLLLGSGVSLDSESQTGEPLMGATKLAKTLNDLKKTPQSTPLSRVCGALSEDEVKTYLTDQYYGCRPGETVRNIPKFLWRSIFTFNIDDCVEAAYERNGDRQQELITVNYDQPYQTSQDASKLQVVHLHGYSREPKTPYVFSTSQYGQFTRGLNPWMQIVSELIKSEPFIISGTSLNEPDLEFYLAGRSTEASAIDRGPSILVEPYPDPITEITCAKHNLVLVKATLSEFFTWFRDKTGAPPTLAELFIPPDRELFDPQPSPHEHIAFFSTFELVRPVPGSSEDGLRSLFFYGNAPTWKDLAANVDVPTRDEKEIGQSILKFLSNPDGQSRLTVLSAEAGFGKTTAIRRIAYDLSSQGKIVFYHKASAIDNLEMITSMLAKVVRPFVVVVDNAGDHVTLMHNVAQTQSFRSPVYLLAADRSYRELHINRTLGNLPVGYYDSNHWSKAGMFDLIERYRIRGLVGAASAVRSPAQFVESSKNDVVAILACRILNDFKPIEGIVRSIWNHSDMESRRSYLVAVLAQHCSQVGVMYHVLQAAQSNPNFSIQFTSGHPLPLAISIEDNDYVVPLNSVIAERILSLASREKPDLLLEIFVRLATAIAPLVNRRTSIQGTPSSRLAGRLFSAEKVVRPLLGEALGQNFFEATKTTWEWNSRYWEQRALFTQNVDLDLAIQYARHAVAIEGHPFPWTTLASILIRKIDIGAGGHRDLFDEAYKLLSMTLKREEVRDWRPTPHPYATLFHGVESYLQQGGSLSRERIRFIEDQVAKVQIHFQRDSKLQSTCDNLIELLKKLPH